MILCYKQNIISIIRRLFSFFLFDWIFKFFIKKDLLVFNYHEISDSPSEFSKKYNLSVSNEVFKIQLKFIKKYYNIISPIDLVNNTFSRPAALITFDDGFKSTFQNGLNQLSEFKIPSLVFLNFAPIKGEIFWVGLVTYLCMFDKDFEKNMAQKYNVSNKNLHLYINEEDIIFFNDRLKDPTFISKVKNYYGEFANEDDLIASKYKHAYLGNHLYNHYNAVNISKSDLIKNYQNNKELLNKYTNSIDFFSYPFGQPITCFTDETNKTLNSIGAKKVFTAFSLPNYKDQCFIYHRVPMFNYISNINIFKFNCLFPPLFNSIFKKKISYE
jgi:hypothetical protein